MDQSLERPTRAQSALDLLLSRQSIGLLAEPAPQGADLDLILDAGLRAPDHGRLRPWRFVLIRGDARLAYQDLADVLSACNAAKIRNVRLPVRPREKSTPPN